jgi:hypothetical protein
MGNYTLWQRDLDSDCCPGGWFIPDIVRNPVLCVIWILLLGCALPPSPPSLPSLQSPPPPSLCTCALAERRDRLLQRLQQMRGSLAPASRWHRVLALAPRPSARTPAPRASACTVAPSRHDDVPRAPHLRSNGPPRRHFHGCGDWRGHVHGVHRADHVAGEDGPDGEGEERARRGHQQAHPLPRVERDHRQPHTDGPRQLGARDPALGPRGVPSPPVPLGGTAGTATAATTTAATATAATATAATATAATATAAKATVAAATAVAATAAAATAAAVPPLPLSRCCCRRCRHLPAQPL